MRATEGVRQGGVSARGATTADPGAPRVPELTCSRPGPEMLDRVPLGDECIPGDNAAFEAGRLRVAVEHRATVRALVAPKARGAATPARGKGRRCRSETTSSRHELARALEWARPEAVSALGRRARAAMVPWSTLEGVAAACPGRAVDRFAAMQVYTLLRHTIVQGHVRPETAAALARHVLPALESGRLRIEAPADATSGTPSVGSAAYFSEANTLRLGVCPVDLDDVLQAAVIVHEAQHVVQDGERQRGTLLDFERDAYSVQADYLLRASGAVAPVPGGVRLDVAALQDLLTHSLEPVELERVESSFREQAVANLRAGHAELNGPDLTEGTTPEALAHATHAQFPYPAPSSFDAGYTDLMLWQAQGRDASVTRDDVVAKLSQPYRKDGLDAPARRAPRG